MDIDMLRTEKRLMLLRPELRQSTKIMQLRNKLTDMKILHIPLMAKLVSIEETEGLIHVKLVQNDTRIGSHLSLQSE